MIRYERLAGRIAAADGGEALHPDSPLGLEVQRVLGECPDGLKKTLLLKRLRESHPFLQESHLDEMLADPGVFFERPGTTTSDSGISAPWSPLRLTWVRSS